MFHFKTYFKYENHQLINIIQRGRCKAGQIVYGSTHSDGYKVICLNGKLHYLHRVIWEIVNGPIPDGYEIDHIDRGRANNRIENLRLALKIDNMRYRELKPKADGLPIGITKRGDKYQARVMAEGRSYSKSSIYLEIVEQWLSEKRRELHGEFSRELN